MNAAVRRPASPGIRRAAIACCALLVGAISTSLCARAADVKSPLRKITVDAAQPDSWPAGKWTPVSREAFLAFERSLNEESPPRAGYLDECEYELRLVGGETLEGRATGRFRLLSHPALIGLGSPGFAISDLKIDEEPGVWGNDEQGRSHVYCPHDGAVLQFRLSQRGERRSQGVEFQCEWLPATSSRLVLTAPAGLRPEVTGGSVVAQRPAEEGQISHVIELGMRGRSTLRLLSNLSEAMPVVDADLTQTVVSTMTKVMIQSDFGLQPQRTSPFTATISVPPEYTVLRVTMSTGERLPFERDAGGAGNVLLRLPELTAGQRTIFRIVAERSFTWDAPLKIPRIAPTNARLLHEDWIVQVEKPLELQSVDHPGFLQTGLSDEPARETWTFQGVSSHGTLALTAGPPRSIQRVSLLSLLRLTPAKSELRAAVVLESSRGAAYEFTFRLQKPWRLSSVELQSEAPTPVPLTWDVLHEEEASRTVKVQLPDAAGPSRPARLKIFAAAPAAGAPDSLPEGLIAPVVEGSVERWIAIEREATPGETQSIPANWSPVAVSDVPESLRSTAGVAADAGDLTGVWKVESAAPPRRTAAAAVPRPRPMDVESSDASSTTSASENLPLAVAVIETQLAAQGGTEHLHQLTLRAASPMKIANWEIGFDAQSVAVDVRADGVSVDFVVNERGLVLSDEARDANRVEILYHSPAAHDWLTPQDSIAFPQPPCRISHWLWRVDYSEHRLIAASSGEAAFASGLSRPSLTQRWLGPLGRSSEETVFHPWSIRDWKSVLAGEFIGTSPSRGESVVDHVATFSGFEYPKSLTLQSWWGLRVSWLAWSTFAGALLVGVMIRRLIAAAYRTASLGAAIAATGAWFLAAPGSYFCGALLCGGIVAFLLPRNWIRVPVKTITVAPSRGSSILSSIVSTTGAAIVCAVGLVATAGGDEATALADVLVARTTEEAEPVFYVSDRVRDAFQPWEEKTRPLAWLVHSSDVKLTIDSADVVSVDMAFEIVTLQPGPEILVPLPFDGVVFNSRDAATVDGRSVRLTPLSDGRGVAVPVSRSVDAGNAEFKPHTSTVRLRGELRSSERDQALSVHLRKPSAGTGDVSATFIGGTPGEIRLNARGQIQEIPRGLAGKSSGQADVELFWRRGSQEQTSFASARAESYVVVEPGVLRFRTRLAVESPAVPDPFSASRLDLVLPGGANVKSVAGENLRAWSMSPGSSDSQLVLDLAAPPAAPQTFDLDFTLPLDGTLNCIVPSLPLLQTGRLSGHQFAFSTGQAYELELLVDPDPARGIWDLPVSESALALRQDWGLSSALAAVELEFPEPMEVLLRPREVVRVAEIEQSLEADSQGVRWFGLARIETSGRSALMHDFVLDPSVEITEASVVQNDVERLIRWIREDDRLRLLLRDDRPGTQVVRLSGRLRRPPDEWAVAPVFELRSARTTRAELVMAAGEEGRLESRSPTQTSPSSDPVSGDATVGATKRYSLLPGTAPIEIRWLKPAVHIDAEEFVAIEGAADRQTITIDWRLMPMGGRAPDLIEIDQPAGVQDFQLAGDYVETGRTAGPRGQRLTLERVSAEGEAWVSLKIPATPAISSTHGLPRLVNGVVPTGSRWLGIAAEAAPLVSVSGAVEESLADSAPGQWKDGAAAGELTVYQNAEWRLLDEKRVEPGSAGSLWGETVISRSGSQADGLTKLMLLPSQLEAIQLMIPEELTIHGLWIDGRQVEVDAETGTPMESVVLREMDPAGVVIRWQGTISQSEMDWFLSAPSVAGFEVLQADVAVCSRGGELSLLGGVSGGDAEVSRLQIERNQSLLRVAELGRPESPPPDWFARELRRLAADPGESAPQRRAALSHLKTWKISEGETPVVRGIDPLFDAVPDNVAGAIGVVAHGDPQSRIVNLKADGRLWAAPAMTVRRIAAAVWFVVALIFVRRALKLLSRWEIADRLASRPMIGLAILGLAWWLAMNASFAGFVLFVIAVVLLAIARLRAGTVV